MQSLWKKIRRWLAYGFLFTVVLLGSVAILLNTESGSRFVLNRVTAAFPGSLYIGDTHGTLWRTLNIRLLRYRNAQLDLSLTEVELTISWPNVLTGSLVLNQLHAEEFEFRNLAVAEVEPSLFEISMPPVPLPISIGDGQLGEMRLLRGSSETVVQQIAIENFTLIEDRIRIDSGAATITGTVLELANLDTRLNADVPLAVNFDWYRTDDAWSGEGSISGSLENMAVSHFLTAPHAVSIEGDARLLGLYEPEFDLQIDWPIYAVADAEFRNGSVHFRGKLSGYDADFSTVLAEPRIPEVKISGTASGNTEGLSESNLLLEISATRVSTAGRINWLPAPTASLEIQVENFDPALVNEQLTGLLAANAHLEWHDATSWDVSRAVISGTLNESEISASGDVSVSAEDVSCDSCEILLADNRFEFDGRFGDEAVGLDVNIDAPSIGELQDYISGSFAVRGRIDGTPAALVFTGTAKSEMPGYDVWRADSLQLDSGGSGLEILDLSVAVTALQRDETYLGSFSGALNGTDDNFEVDLTWTLREMIVASAFAKIARTDLGFNGTVSRAAMDENYTGHWELAAPVDFVFEESNIDIGPHRWTLPQGQVEVSRISATPDQTAIISSITNLPLATVNSLLPQQYRLGGTINAEIDVTRSGDDWLGSVDWQQADTVLYLVSPGQDPYEFRIPEAIVKVDFAEGGAEAEATLRVDPGVSIRTTAKLDSLTSNPLIEGRLRIDGDEWGWISSLVPEVANFGGDISADISASGPLLSPDLSGQASWLNGNAAIPALNVPLTEINITASGAADGSATVNGGAMAGTGSIEISGQFADLMQADRRVELTITGEAADLMNWPDYQVKVSPDLVVVGTPGGWDARGTMEIPQAEIIVREIVENAVTVSPDIVAASDDYSTPRSAARYSGEARLVLSEDVHIAAFGLDTNVSGELLVRKSPDQQLTAEGQIELSNGEFVAYGQRLMIEEGTLTFTGPLDNPIVDVTATRTIENFDSTIVAGIRLRGRANNLNSTVYSEPAMAEADALSYLMIGRPLAEASNSEGSQLAGAALGLGLKQASRLTEQIGQSVGLDELTFIGDGGDATALVAGKQINSRLYARYAYGVFSRLGMILIRYRLSERLSLEAGAGETQSIDILYSVETE